MWNICLGKVVFFASIHRNQTKKILTKICLITFSFLKKESPPLDISWVIPTVLSGKFILSVYTWKLTQACEGPFPIKLKNKNLRNTREWICEKNIFDFITYWLTMDIYNLVKIQWRQIFPWKRNLVLFFLCYYLSAYALKVLSFIFKFFIFYLYQELRH